MWKGQRHTETQAGATICGFAALGLGTRDYHPLPQHAHPRVHPLWVTMGTFAHAWPTEHIQTKCTRACALKHVRQLRTLLETWTATCRYRPWRTRPLHPSRLWPCWFLLPADDPWRPGYQHLQARTCEWDVRLLEHEEGRCRYGEMHADQRERRAPHTHTHTHTHAHIDNSNTHRRDTAAT